jgi:hypothetical protein
VLAAVHFKYRRYFAWQDAAVTTAVFNQRIESEFGSMMAVHQNTPQRTLRNWLHQTGGSDMLRIATVAGTHAGIMIIAPVHDAVWIMAPLRDLDDAIATMSRIMVQASVTVTRGLEIPVEVSAKVCWPYCLGDVRRHDEEKKDKGQALWLEIQGIVKDILRRKTG